MAATQRQIEPDELLAIEYRPIDALVPYARNARTHSEAQVALIAGSIREYGFVNPVLVDGTNGIIAGHGRVMAARKLGLGSVPVIELAHLGEAQRGAYILADNRLAEQAGWDREMLALEVADLSDLGIDLGSLGFEAAEIDALLNAGTPDPREEETPEPPAIPVSQPDDLWLLGRHRLLCGSSIKAANVSGWRATAPDGDRSALRRKLRPGLAQRYRRLCDQAHWERYSMTNGPTGARPGRCVPERWPMSGTGRRTHSSPEQAVYEPFSGSGTSIIAAETCGRTSLSMELDPAYVDAAVTRWQDFTGKAATLEGDGRSCAEITTERQA